MSISKKMYPSSLKPGYFLGQEASSISQSAVFRQINPYFKAFTSLEGAKAYFDQLAGKVDGLDYVNYWYTQDDGEMARKIAEEARACGIDMWAGIRWQKQFRDIPVVPPEYIAWSMDEKGSIYPVLWEERNHTLDYLNNDAVDWMLNVLEERYWPHVKGAVNGYFFPESRVTTPDVPRGRSGMKPWTLHAYSPYVLRKWREYCTELDVRWEGSQVDRFPVPYRHMTEPHPDKTVYIPDNRPRQVPSFTRFLSIPRGTDVWLAWEDFLCKQFHEAYIHRTCERVNQYNADVPNWRGVCFFNNDTTSLDYRDFNSPEARTGCISGNWPQGRRMGIDLKRLLNDREITCFITETTQNTADYSRYEENYLSLGMALAKECGREKDYGFMVHYTPAWGGIGTGMEKGSVVMDDIEEELRWDMIHKYRPPVFSFYSIPLVLVKEAPLYDKKAVDRFWERVIDYKKSFWKD